MIETLQPAASIFYDTADRHREVAAGNLGLGLQEVRPWARPAHPTTKDLLNHAALGQL